MNAAAGTGSELLVARTGSILVMTLNRPEVRNAVNAALAEALAAALDELDRDPELRVGILTGAGGTFCSGLDLKAFLNGEPRYVEGRGFAGLTEAPSREPLIAAVEGAALAGGWEIVLALRPRGRRTRCAPRPAGRQARPDRRLRRPAPVAAPDRATDRDGVRPDR